MRHGNRVKNGVARKTSNGGRKALAKRESYITGTERKMIISLKPNSIVVFDTEER